MTDRTTLFVNAAAWGLLVTGKLVDSRSDGTLEQALGSLLRKGGVLSAVRSSAPAICSGEIAGAILAWRYE